MIVWRHVALVATRECRQVMQARSFWLTIVLLPCLFVGGGIFGAKMAQNHDRDVVTLIDPDGHTAPALAAALRAASPDLDVVRAGASLEHLSAAQLDATLRDFIKGEYETGGVKKGYVIAIPPNFPKISAVRVWISHREGSVVMPVVRSVLAQAMRRTALAATGLDQARVTEIEMLAPHISVQARRMFDAHTLSLLAPTVLAFNLMAALVIASQWLLNVLIEERSGKLLETILACVTPDELLWGKLVGGMAAFLCLFAVWTIALLVGAGLMAPKLGIASGVLLAPLLTPHMLIGGPLLLLPSVAVAALMFLTVGIYGETQRDVQGMMMPLNVIMVMPPEIMLQMQLFGDRVENTIRVAHWVPLWAPFLEIVRLPNTPAWMIGFEVLVEGAFCVGGGFVLRRLFKAGVLNEAERSSWIRRFVCRRLWFRKVT